MARNNWTREETILAFNLYCKVPFGKIHASNPEIIQLANYINRTPSAVAMKMCNLAAHDPIQKERGVKGLLHGCKTEKLVWEEFEADWEALAVESEEILRKIIAKKEVNRVCDIIDIPYGNDKEQIVKQRVGQNFFRSAVLSAYNYRCCITGMGISELLIASHIKPWNISDVKTERTNPSNGLCLNALHDKAFDKGFITLDMNYKIIVSPVLGEEKLDNVTKDWITGFKGKQIILPNRFKPDKKFLQYHQDVIFKHN